MNIIQVLNSLSANVKICFQWVLLHVNVFGNEIINGLAREGSHKDSTNGGCLTFSKIATRVKENTNSSWKQAPVHEWYEGNRSGAALLGTCSRRDETNLARGFAVDIPELNGM
ncbi:RNase H domain-containing protein [Trichonephila clavipes]|nr:RNase H domain-containing protein [Trichonephila clavipes]